MAYSYFKSASNKIVITGPGLITGSVVLPVDTSEIMIDTICNALTVAFSTGKKVKCQEIKQALEY